ncbi:hypothetical protein P170DRAFT_512152 [Aspergillus steynii IBT 23096]|uniref:Zn(2)-C6 fungal-type domain-containing protein n=1 Tax=Aspergillus steynii IBT 23096 TaxID=1392250 RepID=A0A2I2FXW8_9EURO|nr:uncharacterized protein P170DRAFT_512152 [Aspergillus steynii IBT 23096]PLB45462.1 hypothetical protein P170DRAFT_512152 [Aspergillus steynii IBT 23096]
MSDILSRESTTVGKEKKRTRVQLSCTACRSRKLKCCRTHPCTNCKRRGEAHSCTFIGRGPRGRASNGHANPTQVQDRLQHLENLILSLTQKKTLEQNQGGSEALGDRENGSPQDDNQAMLDTPVSHDSVETKNSSIDASSKLLVKDTGTSYIDGAHWSAILEEINGVKEYLEESDDVSDEEDEEEDSSDVATPTLLFGLSKPASKEDLLADIPPRPVTDRLISQFFNSSEPFIVIFHIFTFQSEYNKFWEYPEKTSLPWLGLIYGILTMSVSIHQRLQEPLPSPLKDPANALATFRKRTAQCLAQSNYTKPGRYKVEALFLCTMGEFYRTNDAQVGVSFMLGLTIRLAMRMGYHRDPQHFPGISPFDGEIRRRVWGIMSQLDCLISFQVGVPRTIQDWQHDVELPRNLSDEDIYPDMEQLPPSKPDNELTATSYARAKSRIMSVFGKISDLAYSREPVTYEKTLGIDRRLEEAHNMVTPTFKMRPLDQSIADPAELILRRYTLQLLYLKARCVLHRRYLGEVHSDLRYAYSRWVCMSASKEILRHQADLYHETQPGGILYRERQFPNSLQYADYLLAAMIICLELSSNPITGPESSQANDVAVVIKGREDLLATLEMSHSIFEKSRRQSVDAQKAHAALTMMLRRVKNESQLLSPQKVPQLHGIASEASGLPTTQPPAYGSWQASQNPSYSLGLDADAMADATSIMQPPLASLDVIGDMLDAPTNLDWGLWDQQIQGLEDRGMSFWNDPGEIDKMLGNA